MSDDGQGNAIALYDSTTLFNAGSNSTNGRYMYHAMDATVGPAIHYGCMLEQVTMKKSKIPQGTKFNAWYC